MKRAALVLVSIALLARPEPVPAQPADPAGARQGFQLVEATLAKIQRALRSGVITSEQLVQMYLARIAAYDDGGPRLNAFIHLNEAALDDARARDHERKHGGGRGPLFGVPVLLKDNIDTDDMPTTAGSVALAGSIPPDDASIAARLRDAGAIILGKATLTEFANFIAIGMPSGYSSLG